MLSIAAERPVMSCSACGLTVDLLGDVAPFKGHLASREASTRGVVEIDLVLESSVPASPPEGILLRWSLPAHDLHCCWRPDKHGSTSIPPDFCRDGINARAAVHAPVMCLHSTGGINRLCVALDDALHTTRLWVGLREENGLVFCTATPFAASRPPATRFAIRLRLDSRPVAWRAAMADVRRWWESMPGYAPAAVPAAGYEPVYSTWYSMHQTCPPDAVEEQCRLARPLGCASVIVDDGWQTLDTARGYAFTGDWEPERMGDMRAHVDRVHATGMRYLLWFSVPFVGYRSKAYRKFETMLLRRDDRMEAALLDPRFPAVREHLAVLYEQCMRAWNLDGLKLDFIDSWWGAAPAAPGDGRDIVDLDVAIDVVMKEIMRRVRGVKPDAMIEFRQGYVGPLMRTYGNLFRAGDCPGDILANRARTLDLRILCGGSAVHADMLMWHADEPVESAALQLLAVLFAVPQISVDLAHLRRDHSEMLRFWTGWWRTHRDTLLHGSLDPRHPELGYPVVQADSAGESIVVVYADNAMGRVEGCPANLYVVNASRLGRVVVELPKASGRRRLTVRDCMGRIVSESSVDFAAGAHVLAVPPSGVAELCS